MKFILGLLLISGVAGAQTSVSILDLLRVKNQVSVGEIAAPSTPPSGQYYLYAKTDGKLYGKNDAGTEIEFGAAGGSGVTRIVSGTGMTFTPSGTISTVGTIGIANTAVTAGTYISPSSITVDAQGRLTAASGGWTKYTFSYTAFSIANTERTINLRNLAAREYVEAMIVKHQTQFAGGGATVCLILVGDTTNSNNYYFAGFDVFSSVSGTNFQNWIKTASAQPDYQIYSFTTTEQLNITLTCDVNLNTLTSGSVRVYIKTATLEAP